MGMIPRAIDMIFAVSKQLQDRGWKYQMEGQFLEVYNEVVRFCYCCTPRKLTADQRSAGQRAIRR
jgi:hypothetical protein